MKAVVATGHARVTEVAGEILRQGGNAFDAAIAAGFSSTIVETALSSLGGGGFLLARTADGESTLFDFFGDTPGRGLAQADLEPQFLPVTMYFPHATQEFNVGLGAIAVPGNLRGFLHVHARLGRLPLADVVAPAIHDARSGVTLSEHQGYFLDLVKPMMTLTAAGRKLFEPGGTYLTAGAKLTNPDLAAFLETLPRTGDREFYQGGLAQTIARDMREGRGLVTEEDLAAYRVIERRPLRAAYRGHEILTNPRPAFGGTLLSHLLGELEPRGIDSCRFGDADHVRHLADAMMAVDRRRASGELDFDNPPSSSSGTTHLSISDAAGNLASMTISNGEGSGYIVPQTGIMLNNMMGEDDLHPNGFHAAQPGLRVSSMMSPTLVLRDNKVVTALGSGGSKRIRTALLQVISNVIDFGAGLTAAVENPRVHWDGTALQFEPGFDGQVLSACRGLMPINQWETRDMYFGGVHAISPTGDCAGDPRRGGCAATF